MEITTGTAVFYSGIALAIISFILLIVFLITEKKRKKLIGDNIAVKYDTTNLLRKKSGARAEQSGGTETIPMAEYSTETVPMDGTALMRNDGTETVALEDDTTRVIDYKGR